MQELALLRRARAQRQHGSGLFVEIDAYSCQGTESKAVREVAFAIAEDRAENAAGAHGRDAGGKGI